MKWESLDDYGLEFRAKVPGGWLVKILAPDPIVIVLDGILCTRGYRETVTYVPDSQHTWRVK